MVRQRRGYEVLPVTVLGGGAALALGLGLCLGLSRAHTQPAWARALAGMRAFFRVSA